MDRAGFWLAQRISISRSFRFAPPAASLPPPWESHAGVEKRMLVLPVKQQERGRVSETGG